MSTGKDLFILLLRSLKLLLTLNIANRRLSPQTLIQYDVLLLDYLIMSCRICERACRVINARKRRSRSRVVSDEVICTVYHSKVIKVISR